MTRAISLLSVAVALCGCGRSRPAVAAADSSGVEAAVTSDSMVLRMSDGAEIWLAASRPDTAVTGTVCAERLFEIRRDSTVLPVPLLYTMGAPEVVSDSTVRAALYRHCVPGAWYIVNTRTGQPVPAKP